MAATEVLIENIGPIEELRLTAEPGKITVLTGPNGVGKTQALEAVDALASGKSGLSNRDRTTGGTVQGFGVTIKIGRGGANRRSGDLEIESVEDRLNIASLVDPGLKDPVAADARRIKALVTLTGVDADPNLFFDLAGGRESFFDVVDSERLDLQPDLVAMAACVKRDFETAARNEATRADNMARDIQASVTANKGIDLAAPHDREELQTLLQRSYVNLATERQRGEDAEKTLRAARLARERLETARAEYDGPTVEEAKMEADSIFTAGLAIGEIIDDLQSKLHAAREELDANAQRSHLALLTVKRAKDHDDVLAGWDADVKASENVSGQDALLLDALDVAVTTARTEMEDGTRVRDAIASAAVAAKLAEQKILADHNSRLLRDAAHGTEDVLSRLVAEMGGVFKVDKNFRLVVQHPVRGETFYAELSEGERWAVGLDVAIEAFERTGRRGLLAIPQDAWEGLDADNRRLIANYIEGTDLAVVTAQASRKAGAKAEISVGTFVGDMEGEPES